MAVTTETDAGETIIQLAAKDAAVVWNAADGSFDMMIPSMADDDEVPEQVLAVMAAAIALKDPEARRELIETHFPNHGASGADD